MTQSSSAVWNASKDVYTSTRLQEAGSHSQHAQGSSLPSFPVLLCFLPCSIPPAQWDQGLLQASRCQSVQYPHLWYSLSLLWASKTKWALDTWPLLWAQPLWLHSVRIHSKQLPDRGGCSLQEADSKAVTTTQHQHSRDLLLVLAYIFVSTHSTSSIHTVLSCSALNSAHQQTLVWRNKSILKSNFFCFAVMYLYELVQTFTWVCVIEITLYIFLFQDLL